MKNELLWQLQHVHAFQAENYARAVQDIDLEMRRVENNHSTAHRTSNPYTWLLYADLLGTKAAAELMWTHINGPTR